MINPFDYVEKMKGPERAPLFLDQEKAKAIARIAIDSYSVIMNEKKRKKRITCPFEDFLL